MYLITIYRSSPLASHITNCLHADAIQSPNTPFNSNRTGLAGNGLVLFVQLMGPCRVVPQNGTIKYIFLLVLPQFYLNFKFILIVFGVLLKRRFAPLIAPFGHFLQPFSFSSSSPPSHCVVYMREEVLGTDSAG